MALNLRQTVIEILKSRPNQPCTARQLAQHIFESKKEECLAKMERSKATIIPINTEETLLNQLVAEISSSKNRILQLSPNIRITAERPRKYYYSEKSDAQEIRDAENHQKQTGIPNMTPIPCFANTCTTNSTYIPGGLMKSDLPIPRETTATNGFTRISSD